MGCQLSVEQGVCLAVKELGLEEADLQGWRLNDNHVECLGLVCKIEMMTIIAVQINVSYLLRMMLYVMYTNCKSKQRKSKSKRGHTTG